MPDQEEQQEYVDPLTIGALMTLQEAAVYAGSGDYPRAIASHEQALVISRAIGDIQGEAIGSWNLGLRYEAQGDLARAVELMQVWVDFLHQIGHAGVESRIQRLEEVKQKLAAQGG